MAQNKTGTKIVANSSTHVALLYLKMCKAPINPEELCELNPKLFNGKSSRSLNTLVEKGFATKVGNKYVITPAGFNKVYSIVQERGPRPVTD